MKKVILLVIIFFLITGCRQIKDLSYDDVIKTLDNVSFKPNIYRQGYKYYLARGMSVSDSTLFNEILTNGQEEFYLYVDALSYKEKVQNKYQVNSTSYYSRSIGYADKFGYVEINARDNEKYLIEIMYNYAKIEVMVDKDKISGALLTCINILKSIDYNDDIIANIYGENVLNYAEEEFNIFDTVTSNDNYLQTTDTDYEYEEDTSYDTDLIN